MRRKPIVRGTGRSGPVTEVEAGDAGAHETPGARWRQESRERVTDMNARVSGELREYHAWLDGVEPAWTELEPARWEALMREPSAESGALRLTEDLTDAELDRSAVVRNTVALIRAAAQGEGLALTARGYLTRANVAALREAMHWPGCAFEERRRAGKHLSEAHVGELRLVRALLEEARCVETARADRLRASRRGQAFLAGARGGLFAELFRLAFLAPQPQPVRHRRVRVLAAAAGRHGALGAVDHRRSVPGDAGVDGAERAARRSGVETPRVGGDDPVLLARAAPALVVRPGRMPRTGRGPRRRELAQERAVRPVPQLRDGPREDRRIAALTRVSGHRRPGHARTCGAGSRRCLRRTGPGWDIGRRAIHAKSGREGMNNSQIADRLAGRMRVSRSAAAGAVDAVFENIGEAIAKHEEVRIAGFCTFPTKHRPARTGRNPRTGEPVSTPAAMVPAFRAGKAFNDTVNER